ncbi:hypothetical protein LJC58_07870 [Lachnospiraceae bacterium OttesenSCG-928-D06]|nr:hypothetical protein [Lachnospiraceae bacterium OttesenSCG-928-D06]
MKYRCPVCNYDGLFEAPYDDDGVGSYEICPCCGFEFGCDDFPEKEKQQYMWKQNWIDGGCVWFSKSRKPPQGWDLHMQLTNTDAIHHKNV